MSRGSPRGFTLIEMMIATGIAVVVLVGGMSAGMALQRRSAMEEEKLKSQDEMRSAKEFFSGNLVRAGTPFGNARIWVSGTRGWQFALQVRTDTLPNPFSGNYAAPAAPYAGMTSDYLEVLGKASDGQGIYPLGSCVGSGPTRVGNTVCLTIDPTTTEDANVPWAGRWVLITETSSSVGCLAKVTSVSGRQVSIQMGVDGVEPAGNICAAGSSFWNAPSSATMSLARLVGLRVNWFNGNQPQLEICQDVLASTQQWDVVSRQVERVKVTLGVKNLSAPADDPVWFGYAGGTDGIDECAPSGTCVVPGGTVSHDAGLTLYQQMMRRVRTADVLIQVRSPRRDLDKDQWTNGPPYPLDTENLPLDGYVRRTAILHASPRNLSLAGDFVTP